MQPKQAHMAQHGRTHRGCMRTHVGRLRAGHADALGTFPPGFIRSTWIGPTFRMHFTQSMRFLWTDYTIKWQGDVGGLYRMARSQFEFDLDSNLHFGLDLKYFFGL